MPRLKILLACAGLTSLKRRDVNAASHFAPEPIRRPLDDNSVAHADDWLFDHQPEATAHGKALDALTNSMARLREALSSVADHAPLTVEAEPRIPLGAFSFDADLFDGEPMLAGRQASEVALDADLFEDAGNALVFGHEQTEGARFQHAA